MAHFSNAFDLWANFKSLVHRDARDYPVIDGFRAFAVVWVVVLHVFEGVIDDPSMLLPKLTEDVPPIFRGGDLGVDLFFILSGFLIGDLLLSGFHKLNYWTFLYRRFIRLFPVYALVVFAAMLGAHSVNSATSCLQWWWTNFLFINNIVGPPCEAPPDEMLGCVPQSWSIGIEFQFYLISPLLILALASASAADWARVFSPPPLLRCSSSSLNTNPDSLAASGNSSYLYRPVFRVEIDDPIPLDDTTAHDGIRVGIQDAEPLHPGRPVDDAMRARLHESWQFKLALLGAICLLSISIQAFIFDSHFPSSGSAAVRWFYPQVYQAMYCRVTSYIGGLALAFILRAFVFEPWSDVWRWSGHVFFSVLMFACCWFGGLNVVEQVFSAQSLVCMFFVRPAYSMSVVWFLYHSMTGRAWFVTSLMSFIGWLPLARLSYTVYLMQRFAFRIREATDPLLNPSWEYWPSLGAVLLLSSVVLDFVSCRHHSLRSCRKAFDEVAIKVNRVFYKWIAMPY